MVKQAEKQCGQILEQASSEALQIRRRAEEQETAKASKALGTARAEGEEILKAGEEQMNQEILLLKERAEKRREEAIAAVLADLV